MHACKRVYKEAFQTLKSKFQVLATMFVSVSDSLPKTSYIKMVDVWLITSLLIPFFEVFKHHKNHIFLCAQLSFKVLLQTAIDIYRVDEGRTINHHGRFRTVGSMKDEKMMNNFIHESNERDYNLVQR